MCTSRGGRLVGALAAGAVMAALGAAQPPAAKPSEGPPGMVWIPGGEFRMGSDANESFLSERPSHKVRVGGFWMDVTEVTNGQFMAFVGATGYVTAAERKPDWEELKKQLPPGTPKPDESVLVPGSIVFVQPQAGDKPPEMDSWWKWTPGASWKHPQGPGSTIEGKDEYPVVHVAWEDAVAYAKWAGKSLPTEAQWEFAARGGLERKRFVWGDEPYSETAPQCNAWQGVFPTKNTAADGYERSAPVKSFKPNGYGLYDMAGNVWEWCADWYKLEAYPEQVAAAGGDVIVEPKGPASGAGGDPMQLAMAERVTRGGSFLCHPSYCSSYRPSARRGVSADTSTEHIGFRCVMSAEAWEARRKAAAPAGTGKP